MSRKGRERGLTRNEECVDASIQELEKLIRKSKERQVAAASNSNGIIKTNRKTTKTRKHKCEKQTIVRIFQKTKWEGYTQEDLDIAKKRDLEKKNESFFIAAYNKAIRTKHIEVKIENVTEL